MDESSPSTHVIAGTPIEIGRQLFIDVCMPVVRQATVQHGQGVTWDQIAQMYAGFLQGCMGSLAADVGHPQAIALCEMMVEEFKKVDFSAAEPARH